MKILWAHSHFDTGGGPKTVLSWALGLREMNHEISFIGQGGRFLDSVKKNHFSTILFAKDRFRPSLTYAFQLFKYGKSITPDVLIGVGIPTCMEISLAAYMLKKPVLFIFNVSPRDTLWTGNAKWKFPQISDMVVVNAEFKELCVKKYGWDESRIHYIPERIIPKNPRKDEIANCLNRICIVRRLDHIKSQHVIFFLHKLQEFLLTHKNLTIDIIGDGSHYDFVFAESKEVNKQVNRTAINCVGYIDNIEDELDKYDLVIGTEKVVMEAIISRKATAILKYDGTILPVNENNIRDLSFDNFIGNKVDSSPDITFDHIIKFVTEFDQHKAENLGKWVENKFDYKIGANKISKLLDEISGPKFFFRKYMFQLINIYAYVFCEILWKKWTHLWKN
jgi:hypothetical protein